MSAPPTEQLSLSEALHKLAEVCAAVADPSQESLLLDAITSLLDALDGELL